MKTTAVFLFILFIGFTIQQDAIFTRCDPTVESINSACASSYGFYSADASDLSDYDFCTSAFGFSQCVDASCLSDTPLAAVRLVVPGINRPNICPICYERSIAVTEVKQTCTAWGINVVPFFGAPQVCLYNPTSVLFSNLFFTVTAINTVSAFPGGASYPTITGVRFDYHACAIYSQTWNVTNNWDVSIPTQGWFPHTIHISANATQVFIDLPALNSQIILSKATASYIAVSITSGFDFALVGVSTPIYTGACMGLVCARDSTRSPPPPGSLCSSISAEFGEGCLYDYLTGGSTLADYAIDAYLIDTKLQSLGNSSSLQLIEFQKTGLPLVLTLGSTAIIVVAYGASYSWRRRQIKRQAETMRFAEYTGCCNTGSCCCCCGSAASNGIKGRENMQYAPIRALFCWIIFCLNTHVLGMLYPFTGMALVSAFCGMWILIWVGKNHEVIHFGSSVFTTKCIHITKALLGFALPQQVAIGIIGAYAFEYYLYEVQFWWGLSVLFLLLTGGIFMAFLCLDMSWAAKFLLAHPQARNEQPMNVLNTLVQHMEEEARMAQQPVVQNHVIQVQQPVAPMMQGHVMQVQEQVVPMPQLHVMQPQSHVMQPQPQVHVLAPQEHVMQPQSQSHMIAPQEHVIPQPRPQSHVIEAQPLFYGSPTDAPPPPKDQGAFNPSPVDVYQNPGKYMMAPDPNQFMSAPMPYQGQGFGDSAVLVIKRAIKLSGFEVDPMRESQIIARVQELLQAQNLIGCLQGEDGNAASLRNDLAKNLAEELKMYRNDSMDDLTYGLKEAILLWKDEQRL